MSKKIRYGSVCSGVEAASLAWKELGWKCVFVSEIEPFPCAVLNQKFGASRPINDCPNKAWNKKNKELPEYDGTGIPNEGDFTKIGKKYENKYDLLIGGTPCFPAGTFVLTADGYKPIEDVSVGEFVLTDKLRLKRVLRTGSKIADNLVEVKMEGRPPFFVTSNHPFQMADVEGGEVSKKEIGLSEGKYATLLKSDKLSGTDIYNGELQEISRLTGMSENDCCELIGWYFGCGNGNLLLCGNDENSGLSCVGKFDSIFKDKFPYKTIYGEGRDEYAIVFTDSVKEWFLKNFGVSIRIPLWVYGLRDELKSHIKSGFFSSRFCSDESAFSLFYDQSLFGLIDLCGNKEFYGISVTNEELDGISIKDDRILLNFYAVKPHKFSENADRYFAKIEYVKKVERRETVYNIEVEDDHTYIANGIRVWNCQDASVAGKRKGLIEGSRSKLAFDFVRLAYESRVRWMVWENVPGVFSLNDGKDFAAFLSSFAGWDVTVPEGGWKSAGIVTNATDGNFGLAWRVFDGQYVRTQQFPFAVPQRRRRIFVVGYFGDWKRAAEVLFERTGVYGDIVPCRKTRKEVAKDVGNCFERAMRFPEIYGTEEYRSCGIENGKCNGTKYLGTNDTVLNTVCFAASGFGQKVESDVASTISTNHDDRVTGNNAALILEKQYDNKKQYGADQYNLMITDDVTSSLGVNCGMNQGRQSVIEVYSLDSKSSNSMKSSNPNSGFHKTSVSKTIDTTTQDPSKNQGGMVVVAIDGDKLNKKERKGGSGLGISEEGVSYTLTAKDVHAVAYNEQEVNKVVFSPSSIGNRKQSNVSGTITLHEQSIGNDCHLVVEKEQIKRFNDCFIGDGTPTEEVSPTIQACISKCINNQNPILIQESECYHVAFCDANGTRKDRPNGGCYVTKADAGKTVTTESPNETVVIDVFTKSGKPRSPEEAPTYKNTGVANTLNCFENNNESRAVELVCERKDEKDYAVLAKGNGDAFLSEVHTTVSTGGGSPGQGYPCALTHSTVRRLIPIETERLMGFPDNHTRIKWNGKLEEDCIDGPRYKACGNSFCVNVVQWIGEQIQRVEDEINGDSQ